MRVYWLREQDNEGMGFLRRLEGLNGMECNVLCGVLGLVSQGSDSLDLSHSR